MPTPKKDLEISVTSISLDPAAFKGRSRRLADFRLVYPRLTLAQKTSSKTLTLDGANVTAPDFATWTGGILFKEPVQGTFGVEVSLSAPVADKELEGAAASVGASLLRLLGDAMADAAGIKALGGFLELPAAGLAKALAGKSTTVRVAAQGAADIEGAAYTSLKPGDTAAIAIPLLTEHDVVQERRRASKSKGDLVSRKVLVKAGAPVGTISLQLKAL